MPTAAADTASVAEAHYTARQLVVSAAAAEASRRWSKVAPNNIATSWRVQSSALAVGVAGAQYAAAAQADPYLESLGLSAAEYALVAAALAGVAADGRALADLLYEPAITALVGIKGGQDVGRSLAAGLSQLDTIVRTEVADAGRTADQIATTTHDVPGYVRMVVGKTCNRCIILAGRWYPHSSGFQRHPRCDCQMVPATRAQAQALTHSPQSVYESMTPQQRSSAGWSKAEQQAIADGADIAAVTNIHRRGSLYVAGGRQFTREAQGRGRKKRRPRITPRQIYIEAAGNRDEAIRLLKLHNYIR